ncbi:GntR family transcriptional regulator [Mesorhizobium sp. M4B.F.Ca.ET.017.02.2.1]|nr:GntR family transcriptional regulator [Mesorhizobium sp. M4B.F.Ca.ET.017.02.2.1]
MPGADGGAPRRYPRKALMSAQDLSKRDPNFQAKTFADQVVDAVFEQAAQGILLPGDRILEVELAAKLGVSRAPIREALRILETQGLIESVPYRGMRIFDVTASLVRELNVVRRELEALAVTEAVSTGAMKRLTAELTDIVRAMEGAATQGQRREAARLDAQFHTAIIFASDNRILQSLWTTLRPRLEIIFSLACLERDLGSLCEEHRQLLQALSATPSKKLNMALRDHIVTDNVSVDYEGIISGRRAARDQN